MPSCFAPGCASGYQTSKERTRHFFSAPKKPEKLALWRRNVPRKDKKLTSTTCYLCDLHFNEKYLIKEDKFIINGVEVKIARERWKLHPDGYPTIWPNLSTCISKCVPNQRQTRIFRKETDTGKVLEPCKSENVLNKQEESHGKDTTEEVKEAKYNVFKEKVLSRKRKENESNVDLKITKKCVLEQQENVTAMKTEEPFTWDLLVKNRSDIVLPGENWNVSVFEHCLVISNSVFQEGYAEIDMQLVVDNTLTATTFARITEENVGGNPKHLGLAKKVLSVSDLSRMIQSEFKRVQKIRYLKALRKAKKTKEVHFESSEFEQHRQDGKRRLKPNAIPTLFPNRPPIRIRRSPMIRKMFTPVKTAAAIAREHDHHYTLKKPTDAPPEPDEPSEREAVTTPEYEDIETSDPIVQKPSAILVPITFHPYKPEDLLKSVHARHPTPILPYPKIQLNLPQPSPNTDNLDQENVKKPVSSRTLSPYIIIKTKLETERRKVRKLEQERKNLTQNLNRFLNEDQVDSLTKRSSRGSKWSLRTLQSGIELYLTCGSKGYKMLLDKGYPLPSRRTLRNRLEVVQVDPEKLRSLKDHFGEVEEKQENVKESESQEVDEAGSSTSSEME